MSSEAFNKVTQTHELFKKLTANLKNLLDISFGYMKVFNDGSYYCLMEDLECLQKFVTNVEKSSIFCERNVTNYFDGDYNFTLWPKEPNCTALKVYNEHGIRSGITVSRINKANVELYWFTGGVTRDDWPKFFIRNKQLLLGFIKYFDSYQTSIHLLEKDISKQLFKFKEGFNLELPKSEYIEKESSSIKNLITSYCSNSVFTKPLQQNEISLSKREAEILAIIGSGYSAKTAAQKLNITIATTQCYIERLKHKTDLHYKEELIQFYQNYFR